MSILPEYPKLKSYPVALRVFLKVDEVISKKGYMPFGYDALLDKFTDFEKVTPDPLTLVLTK